MRFIHDTGNALNIKRFICILFVVKPEYVSHPGAAAPLHSYT